MLDHRGVFSTYTLLTTVVNGSENNGLHQVFYLNVWEFVYCAGSSTASIQMSRNMAGSSGAPTTVCNHFTNYSALMQTPLMSPCVIRCVLQLQLVFARQRSTYCVCHDCASAIPYLCRAAPLQFHSAYHLRPSGKWCVQRHPLGVGQQQVSQKCIFLLLFFLSTADLEITRFKIRRQLSSPVCTDHLVK